MPQAHSAKRKHSPPTQPMRDPDANSTSARLSDAQIAADATRRLAWDAAVPEHSVKVKVSRGRITLTGELQRDQQRSAALEDVTPAIRRDRRVGPHGRQSAESEIGSAGCALQQRPAMTRDLLFLLGVDRPHLACRIALGESEKG